MSNLITAIITFIIAAIFICPIAYNIGYVFGEDETQKMAVSYGYGSYVQAPATVQKPAHMEFVWNGNTNL